MDGIQLHDEAVRDRIRLAEEFLDPSKRLINNLRSNKLTSLGDQRARRYVPVEQLSRHRN